MSSKSFPGLVDAREPNRLANRGLTTIEGPNRNSMSKRALKIAVIVVVVIEAIAMVPLILHIANK